MISIKKTALAGLCALVAFGAASNANATVFSGIATFADTTTTNALTVTDYKSPLSFSTTNLTATSRSDCGVEGNCQYFTGFMTLETTDTASTHFPTVLTDNISLTFKWISPSTANNTIFNGVVSETTFSAARDDNGALIWAHDTNHDSRGKYAKQTVNFVDGAQIEIDLYDTLLDGTTSSLAGQFDMQICDLRDPTTVPEPASLALLGLGMIGTGVAARRRKSAVTQIAG